MTDGPKEEERRILQMIADGVVSVDEGDALLAALEGGGGPQVCPWCAEQIPADRPRCPECGEALGASPGAGVVSPSTPSTVGPGLTTLEKILAVVVLMIGVIYLLTHITSFDPRYFIGCALAGCAIASGVLMFKQNPLGWTLGIIWSAAQIVELIIGGVAINRQMLQLGINFNTNGSGLGINLVGVIFLVFFIQANNQRKAVL